MANRDWVPLGILCGAYRFFSRLQEPFIGVAKGQTLVILEAMKMEISVAAPCGGAVGTLTCKPGQMVMPGQRLAVIVRDPGENTNRL